VLVEVEEFYYNIHFKNLVWSTLIGQNMPIHISRVVTSPTISDFIVQEQIASLVSVRGLKLCDQGSSRGGVEVPRHPVEDSKHHVVPGRPPSGATYGVAMLLIVLLGHTRGSGHDTTIILDGNGMRCPTRPLCAGVDVGSMWICVPTCDNLRGHAFQSDPNFYPGKRFFHPWTEGWQKSSCKSSDV
jgi:hypothetical protein